MGARDIDLDYTDDGKLLERVVLNGRAGVTMTGADGAAGRNSSARSLDVKLAPDGAVTSASGRENVRMTLPAAAGVRARGAGPNARMHRFAGRGADRGAFQRRGRVSRGGTDDAGGRARTHGVLTWCCRRTRVTAATFTGDVTFEEPGVPCAVVRGTL